MKLRLLLCLLLLVVPVQAQNSVCNQSVSITVAAAGTATIAPARPGYVVYVCSWLLTSDTAGTRATFFTAATTNLTGAMVMPANGIMPFSSISPVLFGTDGASVTLTAGTGGLTGFVNFAQR